MRTITITQKNNGKQYTGLFRPIVEDCSMLVPFPFFSLLDDNGKTIRSPYFDTNKKTWFEGFSSFNIEYGINEIDLNFLNNFFLIK